MGLKINQMSYLGRRQQGTKAAAARKGKKQLLFGAESDKTNSLRNKVESFDGIA